jgi:hypothetical protein
MDKGRSDAVLKRAYFGCNKNTRLIMEGQRLLLEYGEHNLNFMDG